MNGENEVGPIGMVALIGFALIIDATQALISLIPVIGEAISMAISVFAFIIFYLWFKIWYGMDFSSPKRTLTMGGGLLLEMIPIADMLPAWTATVVILIGTTKVNEMLAKSGVAGAVGGAMLNAGKKLPSANKKMPTVPWVDTRPDRPARTRLTDPNIAPDRSFKKTPTKQNIEDRNP